MVHDSEKWRVIPSFTVYEASTWGNIRRIVPATSKKFGKCLKSVINNSGYRFVILSVAGKRHMRTIHRLVAEAFHGPRPAGYFVDHKDIDKLNNQPDNLRYITEKESCQQGSQVRSPKNVRRGTLHPASVYTAKQVKQIRKLREQGWTYHKLAKKFGRCYEPIRKICLRRAWAHVK